MASLFHSESAANPADALVDLAADLAAPVLPGHWDALRDSVSRGGLGGPLAPHWAEFFRRLGPEGFEGLPARESVLRQQIHDDGVTYNVYADPKQPTRAWSVDLFPLIVDAATWAEIATGVEQRTALLNAIMADIYDGPQHTLREGLLPPALVQGHPGYLRTMHGHRPPGDVWLHIAAYDLARGPDGQWRLVNQRVQAPSGLGYLLENRILVSRLFPEAFSALKVQRLAASYRTLMDTLQRLSPGGPRGRIVLLTPGPYSETYFEQAYLARYLGITLAEGNDLTVREDRLFLKTLHGLEPVHTVLRRLDDSFCDPLELRPDSMLGIPGLLQAVRAGNVLLANALGAGFLESPALCGFMPRLCESLLGQPLLLPSLPSWWCGEPGVCDAPLEDLRAWVVKPVHTECGFDAAVVANLDYGQLPSWRKRVQAQPAEVALQQYLPLPQVPVWNDGRMGARAAMLRVYALSDGRGGWHVLPGGLVRTAPPGSNIVSMQRGGSSQDAWVITGEAVDHTTMLPAPIQPQDLKQHHRVVTSRAAENLFWIGRYTERAEHSILLTRLTLEALSGDDDLSPEVCEALDQWCRRSGLVETETPALTEHSQLFERALIRGLGPGRHAGGIVQNLQALGHAAAQVRERLGSEHRKWIDDATAHEILPAGDTAHREDWQPSVALQGLDRLSEILCAITGAQTDRMTRDDGWRLLSIGRHIERLSLLGDALTTAFDTKAVHTDSGFNLLLRLFNSIITYRALYQKRLEVPPLLDLLVLDRENPRALGWVAQTLRARLVRLPGGDAECGVLLALAPDPDAWLLTEICAQDADGHYSCLEHTLGKVKTSAWQLSDEIGRRYFAHVSGADRSLGGY